MVIKGNPYSDQLKQALQAVSEMLTPDYTVLPVDPTDEMLAAGKTATGLDTDDLQIAYRAMVLAFVKG